MQFGKYTLFSAYGSTADGSMFSVAFTIMFGNENKESWGHFLALCCKTSSVTELPNDYAHHGSG
jgi:hypothetical protein